jgi:hypothetical protein
MLNRNSRENEGDEITPLLRMPPLSAEGERFGFLMQEKDFVPRLVWPNSWNSMLNLCDVCTYRFEFIVTRIFFKNSTNKTHSLSHNMLSMIYLILVEVCTLNVLLRGED